MAGRRVYGGSNTVVILQNEGIAADTTEALLTSGASGGFHGSRFMANFEDGLGGTTERALLHQIELDETGLDDSDDCFHHPAKKRRLTADQVQFLEKSFEMENKLEPERKLQLAKDLGLQPRQVAIWFQNRRARWKTKQLEKDYETLRSSYNDLKADYENLLKVKEKLKVEVVVLAEKLFVKEKGRSSSETLRFEGPLLHHQVQRPAPDATFEVKKPDAPISPCKQEEISSAKSVVLDSDSPHCSDGGNPPIFEPADSSNAFEHDYSDLSHAVDEEERYRFPKLEDRSCHYGFQVEDPAFWLWPSY